MKPYIQTCLLAACLSLLPVMTGCTQEKPEGRSHVESSVPLDQRSDSEKALTAFYEMMDSRNLRIEMTSTDAQGNETTGRALYQFDEGIEKWVTIQDSEPDLLAMWENGEKDQDMAILQKTDQGWEISAAMNDLSVQTGNVLAIVRQVDAIESNQQNFAFTTTEENGLTMIEARKTDTSEGEETYRFTLKDGVLQSVEKTEDQNGEIVNTYVFEKLSGAAFDEAQFDAIMKAVQESGKAVTGQVFPFTLPDAD